MQFPLYISKGIIHHQHNIYSVSEQLQCCSDKQLGGYRQVN